MTVHELIQELRKGFSGFIFDFEGLPVTHLTPKEFDMIINALEEQIPKEDKENENE